MVMCFGRCSARTQLELSSVDSASLVAGGGDGGLCYGRHGGHLFDAVMLARTALGRDRSDSSSALLTGSLTSPECNEEIQVHEAVFLNTVFLFTCIITIIVY